MNLAHSVWYMMICSFLVQIIGMSLIMTNNLTNITFNTGKLYISVIMAVIMGLLEVIMNDIFMQHVSIEFYFPLFFTLCIFIYLYRTQMYIDDKNYLEEMIEHHSMALLTSDEILQKTQSENVKRLAENIISTQEKEIEYMRQLIKYE